MNRENNNSVVSSAENLSMFLTFLTLAWIIYLFPEVINNFFPLAIAKLLLAMSAISMTLFEKDESKKLIITEAEVKNIGIADFGLGLGMVIIFVGFINSFNWIIYKIIMLIFFGFFGFFGMYRGLCIPIVKALFHNKEEVNIDHIPLESGLRKEPHTLSVKIFNIIITFFELGAALVTILTFVGINF